jgi:hypothetical protein
MSVVHVLDLVKDFFLFLLNFSYSISVLTPSESLEKDFQCTKSISFIRKVLMIILNKKDLEKNAFHG